MPRTPWHLPQSDGRAVQEGNRRRLHLHSLRRCRGRIAGSDGRAHFDDRRKHRSAARCRCEQQREGAGGRLADTPAELPGHPVDERCRPGLFRHGLVRPDVTHRHARRHRAEDQRGPERRSRAAGGQAALPGRSAPIRGRCRPPRRRRSCAPSRTSGARWCGRSASWRSRNAPALKPWASARSAGRCARPIRSRSRRRAPSGSCRSRRARTRAWPRSRPIRNW